MFNTSFDISRSNQENYACLGVLPLQDTFYWFLPHTLTPGFILVLLCTHPFCNIFTGGVLFKVYVIGDAIKVVRRYSLPDLEEGEKVGYGLKSFPRVSCAAATAEEADLDPEAGGI
jgi:hypothetical protein